MPRNHTIVTDPPDRDPSDDTYNAVQSERPRRAESIHKRQEGQAHNEISSPVRRRGHSTPHRADVEREELALHPRHVPEPYRVGSHVKYDHGQDEYGCALRQRRPIRFADGGHPRLAEAEGRGDQAESHERDRVQQDPSPPDLVNEQQRRDGEYEIRRGHAERC
ncbi:hypothetical protein NPX13_g6793 [Xylaria arbuscula]|uniref:Uncharacterized protein n=1 Tax=Xylaria arbuscula TaxID=114810 RepID=A0A9W8TLT5_9PEZI|nr:hypothetical protein NPX13_g6793 [Xylaria arbuscula]